MSNKTDIFDEEESLKRDFPLLHSIPKDNPFSVPESYFDSLPSEIMEKCRTENKSTKWGEEVLLTLFAYKWRILSITGCLIIICFFALRINNRPVSYEAMAKTIPDSLIVAHLDKNIYSISESSLEELTEGLPLDQENGSPSVKMKSDSANADQEIITYLVDNNVSISDIENE